MTQQADKALLRHSVKQKLKQLPVEQMQSESDTQFHTDAASVVGVTMLYTLSHVSVQAAALQSRFYMHSTIAIQPG